MLNDHEEVTLTGTELQGWKACPGMKEINITIPENLCKSGLPVRGREGQESDAGFFPRGGCLPSSLLVKPSGQIREVWVQILAMPCATFLLCGLDGSEP